MTTSTSVSEELQCAVIGTGYLGRFHAEKYAALDGCNLLAVVDTNLDAAREVGEKLGAEIYSDYRELLGKVDAVSIVVPTSLHFEVAREFLLAGAHVLVEKPITVTTEEAEELIQIAQGQNRTLQVGHLERFNPAVLALDLENDSPLFIESHRLSPFNPRANDVSVVLDLMIHDIDIILDMVGADVDHMEASGVPVLTKGIDIANARIVFTNGCVANVTASRVSMKVERKMRMFRPSSYVSVDFQNRVLTCHKTGKGEMFPGIPDIETNEQSFESGDALMEEIRHFIHCIRSGDKPLVDGVAGKRALETAIEIGKLLKSDSAE